MAKVIRNMTDEDILSVCQIIDGWSHDTMLTWDALIQAIEMRLLKSWSRQALDRHERIKNAYTLKKKSLRKGAPTANEEKMPADLRKAMETINRLKSENERLTMENNNFNDMFRRWSYNAFVKGFSEDMLNTPLPSHKRMSTRDE